MLERKDKLTAPRPARSRGWLLRSGKSHRSGSKLQRQIRRALIAARGPATCRPGNRGPGY